jgi:parallel beta-helix repeat protein
VSTGGNDAAAGTESAPYRTLTRAISRASSGATIVLRGGSYHESVTIPPGKRLTIQSWPNETVWLDGTQVVTGWAADGNVWRKDGWTTEFDSSPTYTRGAPDDTAENWSFINREYPMAAHPDQLWVHGDAQQQVGSRAEVVPGTFFHDEAANRLYMGSDPSGKIVRASVQVRAMRIQGAGSVIRGIGVRGFAPSVPDMGAVVVDHVANVTLEHVAVVGSATTGISLAGGTSAVLRSVLVAESGMLGIHGNNADGARMERVLVKHNNVEHFNQAPVAGGTKITKTFGFTVVDSSFEGNLATGLWFDASVSDMVVVNSEMRNNAGHGTFFEISHGAVFANNTVSNNGRFGLQVNNTANVKVWNNTFTGNGRSINFVQDNRRPGTDYGRDERRPVNDPNMTWVNGPGVFSNNVIANQRSTSSSNGNCLFCVEDYQSSGEMTAEQMRATVNGNVYNRPSTSAPTWTVVWSRGASNPAVYTSLAAFRSATGQEAAGVAVDGPAVVSATGVPTAAMPASSTALPLPADIAALVGQPTGIRHLGSWSPGR